MNAVVLTSQLLKSDEPFLFFNLSTKGLLSCQHFSFLPSSRWRTSLRHHFLICASCFPSAGKVAPSLMSLWGIKNNVLYPAVISCCACVLSCTPAKKKPFFLLHLSTVLCVPARLVPNLDSFIAATEMLRSSQISNLYQCQNSHIHERKCCSVSTSLRWIKTSKMPWIYCWGQELESNNKLDLEEILI